MTPAYWEDAKKHLSKRDKTLAKIIKSYQGEMLVKRGDAFYTLARSIVGQQISVKAADSVWKRVETTLKKVTPKNTANASTETLRACGLSASKANYMHALAEYFLVHKAAEKEWADMEDAGVIKELTSIKGIGKWTAEMFMIFHLGRADIFPIADIGVQKAIFRHYFDSNKVPLSELTSLAESWRPYRSVATWYLWRSLDPVPVAY
jgi:DNA-3-methyladenine glycosylase II